MIQRRLFTIFCVSFSAQALVSPLFRRNFVDTWSTGFFCSQVIIGNARYCGTLLENIFFDNVLSAELSYKGRQENKVKNYQNSDSLVIFASKAIV